MSKARNHILDSVSNRVKRIDVLSQPDRSPGHRKFRRVSDPPQTPAYSTPSAWYSAASACAARCRCRANGPIVGHYCTRAAAFQPYQAGYLREIRGDTSLRRRRISVSLASSTGSTTFMAACTAVSRSPARP